MPSALSWSTVWRRVHPKSSAAALLRVAAILWGAVLVQCSDAPLLAPEGSRIEFTINPTLIAAGGDTAVLSALVTESDGVIVEDETSVIFVANSGGGFCPMPEKSEPSRACPPTQIPGLFTAKTRDGVARALFISGSTPGAVTIAAKSGSIQQAATLNLSSLAAPAGAKAMLVTTPDTLEVGKEARLTAYLSSSGVPVQDPTRVVFSASDTVVRRAIILTQGGFAHTSVVARKSGALTLYLTSGPLRDSILVPVR